MEIMETTTKICNKCKVEKPYDNFHLHKSRKDGRQENCKECIKNYCRDNSERLRAKSIKWYKENLNKAKEKNKKWRQDNTEKKAEYGKKWRQDNAEKIKKWRQDNAEYMREYQKNRRKSDPIYKMIVNLRGRISFYCKVIKLKKTTRTKEMLGLNLADFKSYMESKFREGMTWENYGQWHVDHIKPLSLATTEQEIIELNHYTNLQPLWAVENLKKSNKYEESH